MPSKINQTFKLCLKLCLPIKMCSTNLCSQLNKEEERLATFNCDWPGVINPIILAKTGFYYTGPDDFVKCFFCKTHLGQWEPEDTAIGEHMRWSPNCPLLKRRPTNNVPREPLSELDDLLPPKSMDVCGPCGIQIRPGSYPEDEYRPSNKYEHDDLEYEKNPAPHNGVQCPNPRCKIVRGSCRCHYFINPGEFADVDSYYPESMCYSCGHCGHKCAKCLRCRTQCKCHREDYGMIAVRCTKENWKAICNKLEKQRQFLIDRFDEPYFFVAMSRNSAEFDVVYWRLHNQNVSDFSKYFHEWFNDYSDNVGNISSINFVSGYSQKTLLMRFLKNEYKLKAELKCHWTDTCRFQTELCDFPEFVIDCANRITNMTLNKIILENYFMKDIAMEILKMFKCYNDQKRK